MRDTSLPPQHDEASAAPAGHWSAVAQRWELVGSPLRPCHADLQVYAQGVASWVAEHGNPRALILGVTPELFHLPWPPGVQPSAVDHTQAMIDALWPGPVGSALNAEWTAIPLPSASIDIALCDGGFHLLLHPDEQLRLVRSLAQIVAPEGLFIVRLFVPPVERETTEQVLGALGRGEIANLNVLKLRLGMALQPSATQGVELDQVWKALHTQFPDFEALARQLNWDLEHLQAIDTYRNCSAHYHFVSVDQARDMLCSAQGGFELVSAQTCPYELGERCPIAVFRRTGSR